MSQIIEAKVAQLSEARLARAQSKIIGLTVGVSEYLKATRLANLAACANDAMRVREAFLDTPQLNADAMRFWSVSDKTETKPTRNGLIGGLKELATLATSDDRLIFYYSGHGIRIGDLLYLVPSDAFSSDDPDALLSLERVKAILNESDARQKLIVLDCCFSGPDTTNFKAVPAQISNNFLEKYLADTKGNAVLSSSANDQASWAKSPDSKLSLFTYYFLRALRGDPESLDQNKHLTLYSLHSFLSAHVDRRARSYHSRQRPGLEGKVDGDFLLGDFSAPLFEIESLALDTYPIRELSFFEAEHIQVKKLLTRMTGSPSRFSEDWLQKTANSEVGSYMEDTFGRLAARFAKELSFSLPEVTVEDNTLYFPDGSLTVTYQSDGKSSGTLEYEASFHGSWLAEPARLEDALLALEIRPTEMAFELNGKINLDRVKAGLPAAGWNITSHLPDRVSATKAGFTVTASATTISFTGFTPSELFSGESGAQVALVTGVLKLLGT